MFLKRLTVAGFKSFCDRVDFDFGPGVTGIVGPNGCGKSNVVDAFKWVLGEQSAKSLRGRQMIDMIFNGSSTRKSSSVAQVDLVFDNHDRTLSMDMDEITVSRKLYRSGESEYMLNQGTTRLKDIRELFMGTGAGVDAYSVIEQGRVDLLLQSSPVDRRLIFEEAAGISRYKARKVEAERKLERTEQNLLRVNDIIDEVEKRLRNVRSQATKARNYKEYEIRLKELRSGFALAEYHRFCDQIGHVSREVEGLTDRMVALRTDLDRHEKDETQIGVQLDSLVDRINGADNLLVQTRADRAAQEERIAAAERRIQEQNILLQRLQERRQADAARLDESRIELDKVQKASDAIHEETNALHASIAQLNEQDRQLARDFTEAQAVLEDEKAGIIERLRKSAQVHNEIVRLNTHRESLVGQKGRLSQRDAQIQAELVNAMEHRSVFERKLHEIEALINGESECLSGKRAEAERVHTLRQRLVDELAKSKEQRSALQSRRDLLDDLERRMEGVGAGVRQVIERTKNDRELAEKTGFIGLLADIFEVDVAHAQVIQAVLADADQDLVVADADRFLKVRSQFGEFSGRVSLLAIDRLPPIVNDREFVPPSGFVAKAVDLVRYEDAHSHLARTLLGKTVVVETLDDALDAARNDVTGIRFVTLDGQVVEPDGRVRIGPVASNAGLISRKSELRGLERQLKEIDEIITTLSDQLNRTQAEAGHLDVLQEQLRKSIYDLNTAKVEAAAALQSIADSVDRLTHEQPMIAQEVVLIEQQINEVLERCAQGVQALEALERENKEREAKAEAHRQRIDNLVDCRREVQEKLVQARISLGQLNEKRSAAAETMTTLRRTIHELQTVVETSVGEIEQSRARIADAETAASVGREQVIRLTSEIEQQESACSKFRADRDARRLDLDVLAQSTKTARAELGQVEGERHEREMVLAETKVRRDELSARVKEELGINLAERVTGYQPTEQDWAAVEAEIAEIRGKMERLGNVNLDALNELEELEQRHAFLTTQRDDLTESIAQLRRLIETLNQESKERFLKVFEEIREHFRGLFRKLFGGGRSDIVLEDPENVLDCGIEIVAQPPGKELQVISLMSGGEKSMTAIALLMSIFKTRPAPFAILDEVDAALDEANNDRFNRIVKEFVNESQFLIITHSKRTMSIGDRLYGITMQEPGVSTRVSVQLKDLHAA